jgi:hypothetical protein
MYGRAPLGLNALPVLVQVVKQLVVGSMEQRARQRREARVDVPVQRLARPGLFRLRI